MDQDFYAMRSLDDYEPRQKTKNCFIENDQGQKIIIGQMIIGNKHDTIILETLPIKGVFLVEK